MPSFDLLSMTRAQETISGKGGNLGAWSYKTSARKERLTKLASSINRPFMTSILINFSEFFIIVYNKVKVLDVSVTARLKEVRMKLFKAVCFICFLLELLTPSFALEGSPFEDETGDEFEGAGYSPVHCISPNSGNSGKQSFKIFFSL